MKKVLLASLSSTFLKKKTNLLRQRGFRLFTATSGAEALKLHEEHQFDLIFADLQLEDMGGYTLCSLVRRQEKSGQIPFILISLNIAGSIERAEQSGASAILLRPIESVQLMETIGGFLDLQMTRSRRVMFTAQIFIKLAERQLCCLSHDISNTGILVETGSLLATGSRIVCRFTLPGSHQVETEGEVVRHENTVEYECRYGIKFINLAVSDSRAIDNYAASIASSADRSKHVPLYTPQQQLMLKT